MLKLLTRLGVGATDGDGEQASRVVSTGSLSANRLGSQPADVIEVLCRYLDMRDIVALARTSKHLHRVASSRRVWADLLQRAFSPEELLQDMAAVLCGTAPQLRSAYRLLSLQRPAFLSDAPRTSEIVEHTGSRFRKVLHIDGRRDLNFANVFHGVPPGQYAVVWRLQLQPGFVRGYCNFRAVFSRPRSSSSSSCGRSCRGGSGGGKGSSRGAGGTAARGGVKMGSRRLQLQQLMVRDGQQAQALERQRQRQREQPVQAAAAAAAEEEERIGRKQQRAGGEARWRLQRQLKRWLPASCWSGGPAGMVAAEEAAHVDDIVLEGQEEAHQEQRVQELRPAATGADRSVRGGCAARPTSAPIPATGPELEEGAAAVAAAAAGAAAVAPPHPGTSEGQGLEALGPLAVAPALQVPSVLPPHAAQHPEIEIEPAADAAAPPAPQPPVHLQQLPQPAAQPLRPPPQQQPQGPAAPQLAQAMGQLNSANVKRDAAYAAGAAGGPRYVHRLLTPLWGGHRSSWRQLDPAGPLGHGGWRRLHMGGLTVRRAADVHLHGVLVQMRPEGPEALAAALPPGEGRWRGALVDYVELVPLRPQGLLEQLLPDRLQPSRRSGGLGLGRGLGLGGCSGRVALVAPDPLNSGSSGSSGGGGSGGGGDGGVDADSELVHVPAL